MTNREAAATLQPDPAPIIQHRRRSLRHIDGDPRAIGQDCRAARMQDLVGSIPRLCALIEVFLQAGEDDAAVEMIRELDAIYLEFKSNARTFRDMRDRLRAREQIERSEAAS